MIRNETYTDVNDALPHLAGLLLDAPEVGSRLGDKTKERTFIGVTLTNPLNREVLLPSRKASLPAQIAETMWVLSGRDDINWLSNYLPRALDFSDDGIVWRGAYGPRLRGWGGIDQLYHVVELLRTEPNTRRAVVAIYDPWRDSAPGKDIPCNDFLHFLSRDGRLDLHVFTRSNDLIWGWSGINAFEWSTLLEVVAGLTGLEAGSLHFSISSLHLYDRHYRRAEAIAGEKMLNSFTDSPRFDRGYTDHVGGWDRLCELWFADEKQLRRGSGLSPDHVAAFPEPMLRSWLRVIAYHWTKDLRYLAPLAGTRLYYAATLNAPQPAVDASPFVKELADLHAEKHAAYGDSWKKRGETFSILPNIARKVDRLGTGKETADETSADTAADLLIYLIKYRLWLTEQLSGFSSGMSHVDEVRSMIGNAPRETKLSNTEIVEGIRAVFDNYLDHFEARDQGRYGTVDSLISLAGPLAYRLWAAGRNDEPEEQMHASFQEQARVAAEAIGSRWQG